MSGALPAALLIVLAGLPGTGKTTLARAAAGRLGAIHLRIDTIEQAIRASGVVPGDLADAGYRAAYGVAEDNLRLGHVVVADSVNPIALTRDAWAAAAARAGARILRVELICSDTAEHRRRVEERRRRGPDLGLPDWAAVQARDYRPWTQADLRLDTALETVESAAGRLAGLCGQARGRR